MSKSTRRRAGARGGAAGSPADRGSSRQQQRQRLIDACISALHVHGPSNTTVERVTAIARMSPGIVRFYFESKAAMLLASLRFLAEEFEQQLLVPVSQLKADPVAALTLLVDLYLDPRIASPRKVSVWYSFWGEASSRAEYFELCGQKDANFTALTRDLIGRLIRRLSATHLDPDGIALGLIGVLEVLWQDIAFQEEEAIDRPAVKRRAMAYLKSVFPGQFGSATARPVTPKAGTAGRLPVGRWWLAGHGAQLGTEGEADLRVEGRTVRLRRQGSAWSARWLESAGPGELDVCERDGFVFLREASAAVD